MLRTIDLFAGAGGLSLGFEMAGRDDGAVGYKTVLAVEHDAAAARTYKTNFGVTVFDGDIEAFDPVTYPRADVILAGPPCQGFSPLGRDRDYASRAKLNKLWEYCLSAIDVVRPLAFVIENVPQFQRSAEFEELLRRFSSDSFLQLYGLGYGVMNAADYGVPQTRRRGILVGLLGRPVEWPPPATHGAVIHGQPPVQTVRDAIGDLPAEPTTEEPTMDGDRQDLHVRRNPRPTSVERYKAIPEGGNRFDLQRARPDLTPACWANKPTGTTDVMGRLWWDRPAQTIRTEFYKPEKGRYLHPEAHRPITHREAARLQSFPDSFIFEGSKVEIAKQIGNAVPPLLARAIARHIETALKSD